MPSRLFLRDGLRNASGRAASATRRAARLAGTVRHVAALAIVRRRAYLGFRLRLAPPSAMSTQRYRITVTPLESDGLPCNGRCTIEFEQRSGEDWMRRLEALQAQRRFSGDDCAALTVATLLLKELAQPRADGGDPLATIPPALLALLARIESEPAAH